jgi:hypothetical protein
VTSITKDYKMKDKPIPAKILLTMVDKNATGEGFYWFVRFSLQAKSDFSEPRELRLHKNTLEFTVVFRDNTSFNNWIKNGRNK